jgi:hypothetical protein
MKFISYILTLILPDLRTNVVDAILIMMILMVKTAWMFYIPVWICLIQSAIEGLFQERHTATAGLNFCASPFNRSAGFSRVS